MKKILVSLLAAICLIGTANATLVSFSPSDGGSLAIDVGAPNQNQKGDLQDLDHGNAYLWRLDLSSYLTPGVKINSAVLTFDQIYDWTTETNDILSINIVDAVKPSGTSKNVVNIFGDNSKPTDFFNSYAYKAGYYSANSDIGSWTDPNGGNPAKAINLSFTLNSSQLGTLNSYVSDNKWLGLGIDPDCHYYNKGVHLTLDFVPVSVPEPSSISLLLTGIGLIAGGFMVRRKK